MGDTLGPRQVDDPQQKLDLSKASALHLVLTVLSRPSITLKNSYRVLYCLSKQTWRRSFPFTRQPPPDADLSLGETSTRRDSNRVSPSEEAPPHLLPCQASGGCRGVGSQCRPRQDLEEHPKPVTFCRVPARRSSLQQRSPGAEIDVRSAPSLALKPGFRLNYPLGAIFFNRCRILGS